MTPPAPDAAHVIIDRSSTAKINLGILASIIGLAVMGASYLKDIEYAVSTTNATLLEVKDELARQNGSVLRHSETLILHGAKLDEFANRLEDLEHSE